MTFVALFCAASIVCAADLPQARLRTTVLRQTNHSIYYWHSTHVGNSAQLLTLFCHSPLPENGSQNDVPLVTVLRDTLGDNDPQNNRVYYVWLLSYARPKLGQRFLSAVPFFYWRVADGSRSVGKHDTSPLSDLTAPQHPVMSEIGRNVVQWTMLDPLTTPVRATSRAYRTNEIDHERLHLEEAVSYLRNAPAGETDSELTQIQLNTVIARLEMRKRLLGGLVPEHRAAEMGQEDGFEQEYIRSRNWELLRQCAEKTGLIFEAINVAGNAGQYAVLWFPLGQSVQDSGTSLEAVWKLLNIKNPWTDSRLKQWSGPQYDRWLDENGSLLPPGEHPGEPRARQVQLVPLGVYSLNYPKLPLLLVDFRDKLHVRRHEMTQRTINEVTAGVIGISHFTNWYYYAGADLYDFVTARHGAAMNQAARLDCYSRFRVALALDQQLDPALRKEMQRRVESMAVNPLEADPRREMELAQTRYIRLEAEAQDGHLAARIDNDRRSELARFGEKRSVLITFNLLHYASFGSYTHRAAKDHEDLAILDRNRRIEYQLNFLDALVRTGTRPEVAYDSSRIEASVGELSGLMPAVRAPEVRAHVEATLARLKGLTQDGGLQADCSLALAALKRNSRAIIGASAPGPAAATRTVALVETGAESHK